VCVMPSAGIEAAQTLMVQIWQQLQEQRAPSFSVGFADVRDEDDFQTLITRADDGLYASKRRSRYVSPTVGLVNRLRSIWDLRASACSRWASRAEVAD
jgi:hypothetical protein